MDETDPEGKTHQEAANDESSARDSARRETDAESNSQREDCVVVVENTVRFNAYLI